MNFVADESVDQPIVTRLRKEGHNVFAVVEMEPSISDEAVLALANQPCVKLKGVAFLGTISRSVVEWRWQP